MSNSTEKNRRGRPPGPGRAGRGEGGRRGKPKKKKKKGKRPPRGGPGSAAAPGPAPPASAQAAAGGGGLSSARLRDSAPLQATPGPAGPAPGDRGKLVGLRNRSDLNGHRVEVKGPAIGKDGPPRFRVECLFGVLAGDVLMVKAANLDLDKDRVLDPAMATLVAEMQALAPGAPPPEERRDWAGGLPDEVLAQVAEKIVASRAEAMWAEKRTTERLNNLELLLLQLHKLEDQIHSSTSFAELVERHNQARADTIQDADVGAAKMRFFDHNKDSLFPFAMVCKAWRKAQLKVGGPLLTRVESDLIAPGRAALVKWALAEGCPRDDGGGSTLAWVAAWYGHVELVEWLYGEGGFAMD